MVLLCFGSISELLMILNSIQKRRLTDWLKEMARTRTVTEKSRRSGL
jgi:hypothetical protein